MAAVKDKTRFQIRFSPLAWSDSGHKERTKFQGRRGLGKGDKRRRFAPLKQISGWEWAAGALLLTSNVFFLVAFLTTGWGRLIVQEDFAPEPGSLEGHGYVPREGEYWDFGLWQCCRDDGFCLGTGWRSFYAAARAFSILALLGHVITLAWLVGHTLEKILKYDVCAFSCLIAFSWATGVFALIAVCCFGVLWPSDVASRYHGADVRLTHSFVLACLCCPLSLAAGAMILVHMVHVKKYLDGLNSPFVTAEQLLGRDEEGNIRYI